MTQAELNAALAGLRRALGLGDEADTARLTDVLCAAEESILRYLNREKLPGCAQSLLIELAALKYLRTDSTGARKSASYTEGQLSQSESYYTSAEVLEGEAALLRTLAPYRRVACREGS